MRVQICSRQICAPPKAARQGAAQGSAVMTKFAAPPGYVFGAAFFSSIPCLEEFLS
jgi:hypothetical protein